MISTCYPLGVQIRTISWKGANPEEQNIRTANITSERVLEQMVFYQILAKLTESAILIENVQKPFQPPWTIHFSRKPRHTPLQVQI